MEIKVQSINRYLNKLLSKPDISHPNAIHQLWTQDILKLLALLSLLGSVIIAVFIFKGDLEFSEMFPAFILSILSVPFWLVSRSRYWKWTRPFPALICFVLGAYGQFAMGVHFNMSLYYALAVLLAGLLESIQIGIVYAVLSIGVSIFFGVLSTDHSLEFNIATSVITTGLTSFFCLIGVAVVEWYLKIRLENMVDLEVQNNKVLTKEIDRRKLAEIERSEQEELLRVSEEKFSKAFLISPDSVNINRLEDGVYIDINQGFTKLMGYAREDVIGKSSLDFPIWANPQDRANLVRWLKESGEVVNMEARFTRKWGEVGVGLMSARLLEINGEPCILSITRDITERKKQEEDLIQTHAELESAYESTLRGWVKALEMKEKETANHSQRVVDLTLQIARALKIAQDEMIHIERGALLHDIGKMGIPDEILLKPGPLSAEEWKVMRQHPTLAFQLLDQIPYLHPAINIPYCHHEKWDGSGYPRGLKGEEIPLPARIFAVVDVFDALTSDRPYRQAWDETRAFDYIKEQSGSHFDPQILEVFIAESQMI